MSIREVGKEKIHTHVHRNEKEREQDEGRELGEGGRVGVGDREKNLRLTPMLARKSSPPKTTASRKRPT